MMKYILFFSVLTIIFGVSFLTYSRFGMFNFARGSDSTLRVVRSLSGIVALLSVIFVTYLFFLIWNSRFGIAEIIMLIALITLWIVSGRAIGILPDGQIVTGWFLFSTHTVDFRDHNEDPEIYMANTRIFPKSYYCIEIHSGNHRRKVFVGPFVQAPLIKIFKEVGFNVTMGDGTQQ